MLTTKKLNHENISLLPFPAFPIPFRLAPDPLPITTLEPIEDSLGMPLTNDFIYNSLNTFWFDTVVHSDSYFAVLIKIRTTDGRFLSISKRV